MGLVHQLAGGESLDDYYLNGYGVEGLIMAAMRSAGIDVESDIIHANAEARRGVAQAGHR